MLNWFKRTRPSQPTAGKMEANSASDPPRRQAPTTGIAFDPELIRKLKDDHSQLLRFHGEIRLAGQNRQWATVEKTMNRFRAALTDHLMVESIKLYVYLQRSLKADRDSLGLMRRFSSEMVGIGKTVLDFIDANQDIRSDRSKQEKFAAAWDRIGETLGDRITREEQTLYPMYEAGDIA